MLCKWGKLNVLGGGGNRTNGKDPEFLFGFRIYMPCRTLIVSLVSLVGFQQLLDNLKFAIFEKKIYSVYFIYFEY